MNHRNVYTCTTYTRNMENVRVCKLNSFHWGLLKISQFCHDVLKKRFRSDLIKLYECNEHNCNHVHNTDKCVDWLIGHYGNCAENEILITIEIEGCLQHHVVFTYTTKHIVFSFMKGSLLLHYLMWNGNCIRKLLNKTGRAKSMRFLY